jgi:hypothetical protein
MLKLNSNIYSIAFIVVVSLFNCSKNKTNVEVSKDNIDKVASVTPTTQVEKKLTLLNQFIIFLSKDIKQLL